MRRESLLASPTSPTPATGFEPIDPTAIIRVGEVDGAVEEEEEADGLQDGVQEGLPDGVCSGVNGVTEGKPGA